MPTPLDLSIVAINDATSNNPDEKAQLIATKCRALMAGYARRWADSQYVPVEVERVLMTDIVNPETSRKGKLHVAGKLDVLAMLDGRTVLIDHKTTSDDIADPTSTFWRQHAVENQWNHYMLLKWQEGQKIDEAMIDVIRKPTIAPRQLKTKAERASIVANRRYCNRPITDETVAWLQENDRENLELYHHRLLWDCTEERPQYYFQRRTIPRLDAELLEYASDLWDAGQLVLEARRKNRWPKHPGSCMAYGRPCAYLGICSGFDRADSPNWKRRDVVHSELTPEQDRDTLTYSSIRCYQTCPRRYYYAYDLGIERTDEEESEALFTGSLIHTALEAYWRALSPAEEDHGSCDNDRANSVRHDADQEGLVSYF